MLLFMKTDLVNTNAVESGWLKTQADPAGTWYKNNQPDHNKMLPGW